MFFDFAAAALILVYQQFFLAAFTQVIENLAEFLAMFLPAQE